MLWRVIEKEVVPLSQKEGIGQIVWSPMAQGVLSGKYKPGTKPPKGSRATDKKSGAAMISRWMRDDILTAVTKLEPIAKEIGLTTAQLALAWVLQNKNVSSAIIGATKPAQIKENVKAVGVKLEPAVMRAIDDAVGSVAERSPAETKSPNPRP
jgi:aryl-alcohol dehydrogenase-like predicted oxidoreductase